MNTDTTQEQIELLEGLIDAINDAVVSFTYPRPAQDADLEAAIAVIDAQRLKRLARMIAVGSNPNVPHRRRTEG